MLMQDQQNRFEFYVSFCLMTEKVNPFGHACLVFSQVDNKQGEKAQVEVLDAVGLYSRYMPVLGFKPYTSHGRVKAEEHEYIVSQEGLSHVTYKISAEEMADILTQINEERRGERPPTNIESKIYPWKGPDINSKYKSEIEVEDGFLDPSKIVTEDVGPQVMESKPTGPQFNLFNGTNCKRYALDKLEKIGIDTSNLHGFLEIPKNTNGMQPLKIVKGQRDGKDIYYWGSPLIVNPRTATEQNNPIQPSKQFVVLKKGVDKMSSVLNNRKQELREQGREVIEINNAIDNLREVRQDLAKSESFPNRISSNIDTWAKRVDQIVTKETTSLKEKRIEVTLVKNLIDTAKETFWGMYQSFRGFFGRSNVTQTDANTNDKIAFDKVEKIKGKMAPSLR